MKRSLIIMTVLAALGVGVSTYALSQHYAPLGVAFCNLGETFSCDLVNKSEFSEVFGIPVALIGILGYAGIGALSLGALVDRVRASQLLPWILTASLGGLAFSLYLTYVELFVIGAVCILCIASQALILAIAVLSAFAYRRTESMSSSPPVRNPTTV